MTFLFYAFRRVFTARGLVTIGPVHLKVQYISDLNTIDETGTSQGVLRSKVEEIAVLTD
jgi:hypothetical protein